MPSPSDIDITVKLQTQAETKGIDQARKSISDLKREASSAGAQTQKSAQGLAAWTARIAEITKSVRSAALVITGLWGTISIGIHIVRQLSAAWTAFTDRLLEPIRRAGEEAQKTADTLSDRKIELGRSMVASAADAFDRLASAATRARSAQRDLASAWQDLNTAQREATSLELDRRELSALSSLRPGDTAAEAAVRARFGRARLDAQTENRAGDSIRSLQAAQDDLDSLKAIRASASQSLQQALQDRSTLQDQLQASRDKSISIQSADYGADRTHSREKAAERAQKETEAFTSQLKDLDATIDKLRKSAQDAADAQAAAALRLRAAGIRARDVQDAAASLNAQKASDLDRAASSARWSSQLSALRSRAASAATSLDARAQSLDASAQAYSPIRPDYPSQHDWQSALSKDRSLDSSARGASRLALSAQKLRDQLDHMDPEQLSASFDAITSKLARLEAALKNSSERSKRQ